VLRYAAFIPQPPSGYNAADDTSLPLARRLNAGLKLPNVYEPKEWSLLRRFFPEPQREADANGVLQSVRTSYQPVSWYTLIKAVFGRPGQLERVGDHFSEDPLTSAPSLAPPYPARCSQTPGPVWHRPTRATCAHGEGAAAGGRAHYNQGVNSLPSPIMLPRIVGWITTPSPSLLFSLPFTLV